MRVHSGKLELDGGCGLINLQLDAEIISLS